MRGVWGFAVLKGLAFFNFFHFGVYHVVVLRLGFGGGFCSSFSVATGSTGSTGCSLVSGLRGLHVGVHFFAQLLG